MPAEAHETNPRGGVMFEVLGSRVRDQLGLRDTAVLAARAVAEWIAEEWGIETLEEEVETSASNESSVVQLAELDGSRILLTGDAGVVSLHEAADYAELIGYPDRARRLRPRVLWRWRSPVWRAARRAPGRPG